MRGERGVLSLIILYVLMQLLFLLLLRKLLERVRVLVSGLRQLRRGLGDLLEESGLMLTRLVHIIYNYIKTHIQYFLIL